MARRKAKHKAKRSGADAALLKRSRQIETKTKLYGVTKMKQKQYTAFQRTNAKAGLYQRVGFVYALNDDHAKARVRDVLGYKMRKGDQLIIEGGRRVRVTG